MPIIEEELSKFNEEQKKILFGNLAAIELTKGCSIGCPDCGVESIKGVRETMPFGILERILTQNQDIIRYAGTPIPYYATDPFDYEFEGKTYADVDALMRETVGEPTLTTAFPRGKETEILEYLLNSQTPTITQISIMKSNHGRISRSFSEIEEFSEENQSQIEGNFKPNRHGRLIVPYGENGTKYKVFANGDPNSGNLYILQTPKYLIGSFGKPVDLDSVLFSLNKWYWESQDDPFIRRKGVRVYDFKSMDLPSGRQHALKLGEKFENELPSFGIGCFNGVLMHPNGFDSIQTVRPSRGHPYGQIRRRITPEDFEISKKYFGTRNSLIISGKRKIKDSSSYRGVSQRLSYGIRNAVLSPFSF